MGPSGHSVLSRALTSEHARDHTACTERVNSKSKTTETCNEEFQDFLHCVDHCVAHNLFKHLK